MTACEPSHAVTRVGPLVVETEFVKKGTARVALKTAAKTAIENVLTFMFAKRTNQIIESRKVKMILVCMHCLIHC